MKILRIPRLALPLLLASCQATYYAAQFVPAPVEAPLLAEGDPAGQVRALVTVRGIRRAVSKESRPVEVELKLRLENLGTKEVQVDVPSFELVDSDLNVFGPARIEPAGPEPIAPGAKPVFHVFFPVASGKDIDDYDLGGLNLKLAVLVDGKRVSTGVTFDRLVRPHYYSDPFYSTHVHVGVGVVGSFSED